MFPVLPSFTLNRISIIFRGQALLIIMDHHTPQLVPCSGASRLQIFLIGVESISQSMPISDGVNEGAVAINADGP